MTLLLRLVAGFLAETALWLAAHAAVAALAVAILRPPAATVRRTLGIVLTASVLTSAAAHRSGIAAWSFDVGRRDLPLLWSLAGAAVAIAALRIRPAGERR